MFTLNRNIVFNNKLPPLIKRIVTLRSESTSLQNSISAGHDLQGHDSSYVPASYPSLGTRYAHIRPPNTEPICFFCSEPAELAGLHNALTYSIDTNVRRIALEL